MQNLETHSLETHLETPFNQPIINGFNGDFQRLQGGYGARTLGWAEI